MKQCPLCKRSYEDDTQSFCFDDGATLEREPGETQTVVLPETLVSSWKTDPDPDTAVPSRGINYVAVAAIVLIALGAGGALVGSIWYLSGRSEEGTAAMGTKPAANATQQPFPQATTNPAATRTVGMTLGDALQTYKYDEGWDEESPSGPSQMTYVPVTSVKVDDYHVELHYSFKDGVIKGLIRNNNELDGSWYQSNGSGTISLLFADDFQSASGKWDQSDHAHSGKVVLRRRQ